MRAPMRDSCALSYWDPDPNEVVDVSNVTVTPSQWQDPGMLPLVIIGGILVGALLAALIYGYFWLVVQFFRKILPKKTSREQLVLSSFGISATALFFYFKHVLWMVKKHTASNPWSTILTFHFLLFFSAMAGTKEYLLRARFSTSLGWLRELVLIVVCVLSALLLLDQKPDDQCPPHRFFFLYAVALIYHALVYVCLRLMWITIRAKEFDILRDYKRPVGTLRLEGGQWVEEMHTEPREHYEMDVEKQHVEAPELPEKKPIDTFY